MRKIAWVFWKQCKDSNKNPMIIILFVFFPVMSCILTQTVAKSTENLPDSYFAVLFATIFVGLIPTITMASTIAEEKERNTLRVLIMSNVKPMEYLCGIGLQVLLFCVAGILLFGFVGGYSGRELLLFLLSLLIGVITSLFLGAAIGIAANNQMAANGMAVPFGVVSAFLPMIAGFSASFEKASRFLYTQQINYLLKDLSFENFTVERFVIIFINVVIFIVLFWGMYRKKGI